MSLSNCMLRFFFSLLVLNSCFALATTTIQKVKQYHLSTTSTYKCSRAVSRWVSQELKNFVYKEVAKISHNNFTFPEECPWNPKHLLYADDEALKKKAAHIGGKVYTCPLCKAVLHQEFAMDVHLDIHRSEKVSESSTGDSTYDSTNNHSVDVGVAAGTVDSSSKAVADHGGREEGSGHRSSVLPTTANHEYCLEKYCLSFDVCEGPAASGWPLIASPYSIGRSLQTCDASKLQTAYKLCTNTVAKCFPISSDNDVSPHLLNSYRVLHVLLLQDLCSSLLSCDTFFARRVHRGSSKFYCSDSIQRLFAESSTARSVTSSTATPVKHRIPVLRILIAVVVLCTVIWVGGCLMYVTVRIRFRGNTWGESTDHARSYERAYIQLNQNGRRRHVKPFEVS